MKTKYMNLANFYFYFSCFWWLKTFKITFYIFKFFEFCYKKRWFKLFLPCTTNYGYIQVSSRLLWRKWLKSLNPGFFSLPFCAVGGLVIIHKKTWFKFGYRSERTLKKFGIPPMCWEHAGSCCWNMAIWVFLFSKYGNFGTNFLKNSFEGFTLASFFSFSH